MQRAAKSKPEIFIKVHQPEAIGADHAHAAGLDRGQQFFIECLAGITGFAETGGQDDGKRNTGLAALLDGVRHQRTRYRDQCDVAGLGHRADMGIAGEAFDLRVFRIDRVDLALIAVFGEQLDRLTADARQVGGSADDGDTARIEQAGQIGGSVGLGCHGLSGLNYFEEKFNRMGRIERMNRAGYLLGIILLILSIL